MTRVTWEKHLVQLAFVEEVSPAWHVCHPAHKDTASKAHTHTINEALISNKLVCISHRLQEGLSLVVTIDIFFLHYKEVCCINDHFFQANKRAQ